MTNLFVGQIITAYRVGFHKITKIVRHWESLENPLGLRRVDSIYGEFNENCGKELTPLIYYIQLYDSEGNARKSKEFCCDSVYCDSAEIFLEKKLVELKNTILKLENLKNVFKG